MNSAARIVRAPIFGTQYTVFFFIAPSPKTPDKKRRARTGMRRFYLLCMITLQFRPR